MTDASAQQTGTVYDIGYQRYTGEREGRRRSRVAVFKDSVRGAFGFGRSSWAKVLPWTAIGMCLFMALMVVLNGGGVDDYNGLAAIVLYLFAAIVGPELLCPDRREGVLSLYAVRPITLTDYLFARWLGCAVVMTLVAFAPQVLMWVISMGADASPWEFLRDNWMDLPRMVLAGLALGVFATNLALVVAAFTTRRAYAAVFLVGTFVISVPFTLALGIEIGGTIGGWISLFNIGNIPVYMSDVIFGGPSTMTVETPAWLLSPQIFVAWYLTWVAASAAILFGRYRRLAV